METCGNCNQMIGNMEPRAAWQGRVVCAGCYERLAPQGIGANVPTVFDPLDQLASQLPAQQVQAWPIGQTGPISPWEDAPQPHVNAPSYNSQQVVIHNYVTPRSRKKPGSTMKASGLTLIAISLPFCCFIPPVGLLLLAAGIVLFVIGCFE